MQNTNHSLSTIPEKVTQNETTANHSLSTIPETIPQHEIIKQYIDIINSCKLSVQIDNQIIFQMVISYYHKYIAHPETNNTQDNTFRKLILFFLSYAGIITMNLNCLQIENFLGRDGRLQGSSLSVQYFDIRDYGSKLNISFDNAQLESLLKAYREKNPKVSLTVDQIKNIFSKVLEHCKTAAFAKASVAIFPGQNQNQILREHLAPLKEICISSHMMHWSMLNHLVNVVGYFYDQFCPLYVNSSGLINPKINLIVKTIEHRDAALAPVNPSMKKRLGIFKDGVIGAHIFITEYIPKAQTLYEFLLGEKFNKRDFCSILFQIIYTLIVFRRMNFIHMDLHSKNIMVQKLDTEATYYYVIVKKGQPETIYQLKTKYLVKIFDFDRSTFFPDKNSSNILHDIGPFVEMFRTKNIPYYVYDSYDTYFILKEYLMDFNPEEKKMIQMEENNDNKQIKYQLAQTQLIHNILERKGFEIVPHVNILDFDVDASIKELEEKYFVSIPAFDNMAHIPLEPHNEIIYTPEPDPKAETLSDRLYLNDRWTQMNIYQKIMVCRSLVRTDDLEQFYQRPLPKIPKPPKLEISKKIPEPEADEMCCTISGGKNYFKKYIKYKTKYLDLQPLTKK